MAVLERHTIPVPYGHRIFVLSDLCLSPNSKGTSSNVRDLIRTLDEIDDAAFVVIAGNLFAPESTSDLGRFIEATFQRLPELVNVIEKFTSGQGRRLLVLPGSLDFELSTSEVAQSALSALGVEIVSDILFEVAAVNGVRNLAVVAGAGTVRLVGSDEESAIEAQSLEDPLANSRFVTSRVLYQRLRAWIWIPLVLLLLLDFYGTVTAVIAHFTHHHFKPRHLHPSNFVANLILNLTLLIGSEAILAGVASWLVRQRFDRDLRLRRVPELCEPLSITNVKGSDAVQFAREIVESGGVGAIIGGTPRPALAFLDNGVCAAPGPSRKVLVERWGRFGLPRIFGATDRFSMVEVESTTEIHIRLIGRDTPIPAAHFIERLLSGPALQPSAPQAQSTLGSWPTGSPFPLAIDRLREQRSRRRARRIAAGLILFDGLINVAISVAPPLRSRLHAVLNVLPLGAAQSAAAFTAVAGMVMIMIARGIRRGQRRAWYLAVFLLGLTIGAHFARGGSIVASGFALAIMTFLIVRRQHFQASADRSSVKAALPRLLGIGFIAVLAATLGAEATSRHQLPSIGVVFMGSVERLVGQSNIQLPDQAGDFMNPVLLTVGISLLISALYLFTRPVVDRRLSTASRSTERRLAEIRAREIVRRHGRGTLDYFALRDDKQFFFFRDSLVAYAVYGGVALISPDPIGPEAERTEVFSAFRTYAESRGWTVGVMAAGESWLPIYSQAGLHNVYLGDEAIVNCQEFALEGGRMKGLRQANTRLERHGYRVEFQDPSTIDPAKVNDLLELITMLRRGDAERGFSMQLGRLFNPKDKGLLLTIVYGPDDRPAAVCQFVPSPAINGYSLDLMRRDPGDHPNGLIDFALCQTIAHLREKGGEGLSLNFAAFRSVLEEDENDGAITLVERWALKRLSGVLAIETLWTFNSKYYPTWLPRHLVYPAAESFVPVVAAVLRAESITELPVLGRLLANDPSNRPGTVVPPEVLAAAKATES